MEWWPKRLLPLLLLTSFTKGKIYETTKLKPIEEYAARTVEKCVRSLDAESRIKASLLVKSNWFNMTSTASETSFSDTSLSPEGTWHIFHAVHATNNSLHHLNVSFDNQEVAVTVPGNQRYFTTAYVFDKISLYAKGKVEVIDCQLLSSTTSTTSPVPSSSFGIDTQLTTLPTTVDHTHRTTGEGASEVSQQHTPTPSPLPSDIATFSPTTEGVAESGAIWLWALGEVFGLPVVLLIMIAIVAIVVVIMVIVTVIVCCRKRKQRAKKENNSEDYLSPHVTIEVRAEEEVGLWDSDNKPMTGEHYELYSFGRYPMESFR